MDRLAFFKNLDLRQFYSNLEIDREIICVAYKDGTVALKPNIATNPHRFALDYSTRQEIKRGIIQIIIHSHLHTMDYELSPKDIAIADTYGLDIASYGMRYEQWDFFSPYLPHPYPLTIDDLSIFKDRCYELYRSDCYRFIENCFAYINVYLPTIPRSECKYVYDDNFTLGMLNEVAGWQPKSNYTLNTGDLVVLQFDRESHHFGLIIDNKCLTFTNKGIKAFSHNFTKRYLTHCYELKPQYKVNLTLLSKIRVDLGY